MFSSANSSAFASVLSQTTANLPPASTTAWVETFADQRNITQTVVSSLSIFGSLTIISTYFMFKNLQTRTRIFLVYISIGDLLTVLPYLIVAWVDHMSSSPVCRVQSFVSTTAVMWSFFWTSSLAIYLYLVIVKKNRERADKLMPYFHVVNWGLPLALVAAAWGHDMLGSGEAENSGGWCWIKSETNHDAAIWWMFACGKFWEILSYFVDVILCFIVARQIGSEVEDFQHSLSLESTQAAIQGKRKLILAPILFVLLRIWGTIRFFLLCFNVDQHEHLIYKILIVFHIIGDSAQGFVYFILFCLCTAMFRENIAKVLCTRYKRKNTDRKGRPNRQKRWNGEHKSLLQHPKTVVYYT